jgi:RNA polymerase sigma factor (sigma-70 family)
MNTGYHSTTIRQLRDQQVKYAPRDKKIEQLARAEVLMRELDSARTYSYEYLCYRITDYRPESTANETMSGADAHHDLQLFVEDVSEAADIRAEDVSEPVHTVNEVSKMFNVSTKTISRWRRQGLVSRRLIFDGRKRVGFLKSSVDRFVRDHADRVKRGGRFSQLSDEDRDRVVERARRLSRAGGCPSEITRRIARQMNRSIETIRYTLKQFDENNPDAAVFPHATGPLTADARERIYEMHRCGTSADDLAKKFCRTRTSIYRVINEMRATRILDLPLDYMHNDDFTRARAEKRILAPTPTADAAKKAKVPTGLPPYLASLYQVPLLTKEQELHLFRKFNFLKFKASMLRKDLNPARASAALMDSIEKYYEEAVHTKNRIVQANLRLVVSIAKRHVGAGEDFFHLISDGNMSLIRAAEKFDYGRGNKFSTYASWAIMKNFARTIPQEYKHRDRYRTSSQEAFSGAEDSRTDWYEQESAQHQRKNQINRILTCLDPREQKIIIKRFGLDHGQEPQTLKEVGAVMGVTKERIRQIEARALNKLRLAAQSEKIDLPD